jgi:Domain of unknown function (DUF4440)
MKKLFFILTICLYSTQFFAQNKEEKNVSETIETIRKAMVDGDKATLEAFTHENLSYGHSSGKVENKGQYVEAIASGNNNFETIDLSNQSIQISGTTAVVRHIFKAIYTNNGVAGVANIAVLQVYQKNGKKWLLLARQAVKL